MISIDHTGAHIRCSGDEPSYLLTAMCLSLYLLTETLEFTCVPTSCLTMNTHEDRYNDHCKTVIRTTPLIKVSAIFSVCTWCLPSHSQVVNMGWDVYIYTFV